MALLQTNADHAFAAQVKILKENVGELRDRVAELNTSVLVLSTLLRDAVDELRALKADKGKRD